MNVALPVSRWRLDMLRMLTVSRDGARLQGWKKAKQGQSQANLKRVEASWRRGVPARPSVSRAEQHM